MPISYFGMPRDNQMDVVKALIEDNAFVKAWDSLLQKYSPDQERDEGGRFASGDSGGSSTSVRGSGMLQDANSRMLQNAKELAQAIKLDNYHEDATDTIVEERNKLVDGISSKFFGGDRDLAENALDSKNFARDLKESSNKYFDAMQRATIADENHDDEKTMMSEIKNADREMKDLASKYFDGNTNLAMTAMTTVK